LVSHYLFRYHFCLVARANEKGVVEGLVRYTRQNFLVPVPQVRDFEELNAYLLTRCRDDLRRRVRGQTRTKEQLLQEEQICFLGLPFTPFEACRIPPGHVNRELLVRFDDNDYSVPMEYAYQEVTVKGYTDRVQICRFQEVIAVHPRHWGREQQFFDPLHYGPLWERKPHSLAGAKPFDSWQLPRCFAVLQDRREAQLEHGTREYIGVLRLLQTHRMEDLTVAVEKALRQQVHTRDGLRQFLPDRPPWRQTTFSLAGHPHLRLVQIAQADVHEYTQLLGQGGQT
jgi:hypothetical protein